MATRRQVERESHKRDDASIHVVPRASELELLLCELLTPRILRAAAAVYT